MTQEEKANAYDEALERAKECHIDGLSLHQPVKDVIEYIFPELAEGEDEKIRKNFITHFKSEYGTNSNALFAGIKVKDIIAWLEKQCDNEGAKYHKNMVIIKEDYVSFEIAKLLNEKGFDGVCETSYYISNVGCENAVSIGDFAKVRAYRSGLIAAPTLQMACKWLREKFDLHIIAYPFKTDSPTSVKHYCCRVYKTFNLLGCEKYGNETLTSYEEAVEAAINYCLNNLI